MYRNKKFIALTALVLAVILLFCACASSDAQTEQKTDTQQTPQYVYAAKFHSLPERVNSGSLCASGNTLYYAEDTDVGAKVSSMDLTTGEAKTLYTADVSDNPESFLNVCAIAPCEDGGVWMLLQRGIVNENFETEGAEYTAVQLAADGSTSKEITIESDPARQEGVKINGLFVSPDGTMIGSDYSLFSLWNAEGKLIGSLQNTGYGQPCVFGGQYGVCGKSGTGTGMSFRAVDPKTAAFGSEQKLPDDVYWICDGIDGYDLCYERSGNLYGWKRDTGTSEKLVDWLACDVDSNSMVFRQILPDGRVVGVTVGEDGANAAVLEKVLSSELPQKTELTLACVDLSWSLRGQIVRFNRQNPSVRVTVRDYAEYNTPENKSAGLLKLNTELLSGKVPDLFCADNLPVSRYASSGLLTDLWQMIDGDASLTRDDFVQAPLKAAETDGKLYLFPAFFCVTTTAAKGKVVGDYASWSLADVKDAMTRLQDGATVFNKVYTKKDVLESCISKSLSQFVDWKTGQCGFDSPEFVQLLEFANSFPDEISIDELLNDFEDDYTRLNNGKQLMTEAYLSDPNTFQMLCAGVGDDICFIGWPSASGKGVSAFRPECAMCISSQSQNQTAAWEFIKFIADSKPEFSNLPVKKAAFDALLDEASVPYIDDVTKEEQPRGTMGLSNGTTIEYYAMTEQQRKQFTDVIDKTTQIAETDQNVMDIVTEETGAFFAGQRSAQDTAAAIGNRVGLYLAEQK